MIKACNKCSLTGEESIFFYRHRNTYRNTCKECFKAEVRPRSKKHYEQNKEKYKIRSKRYRHRLNIFIQQSKTNKICVDCKMEHPPHRLQFDHLDPKKKRFNVSEGGAYGINVVKEELAKCEIVCANCHADRTFYRRKKSKENGT